MKYFIVTDVHGYYSVMNDALNKAGFDRYNEDHIFVSLGDLMDRGRENIEVLKYVNSLPRKILIRGNHEDLLDECLKRKEFEWHDYHNGTSETVLQLCEDARTAPCKNYEEIFEYAESNPSLKEYESNLVDYYEGDDFIFVHGWIPVGTDWRHGDWESARWKNGMDGINHTDKTIYCGHYHTSWGHHNLHFVGSEFGEDAVFDPFIDNGIVALDGCVAYSGKVNCFVLEK